MKHIWLALLMMILIPVRAGAYSSPGQPTGYVGDYAGILSDQTKNDLESQLASLEASSSTQVAVVTIKSLDGDSIENFAIKLFEEWQIGQKGKDNGALLLVAVEDRKVRIEVGYGLEGSLTDAQSSSIIRNVITPRFKQNEYDQGVLEGTRAIVKAIAGEYTNDVSSAGSTNGSDESFGIVMGILSFVIPLFLWLVSILARTKSWWLGGVIGAVVGGLLMSTAGSIVFGLIGLFLDYAVSQEYKKSTVTNNYPWWIGGKSGFGGGSSSSGRGFGGFGGGRSGGGGSSGSW